MQLNEHSTLEEIKARVMEILEAPGGLMAYYRAEMKTDDPEEIRREFFGKGHGWDWGRRDLLCGLRFWLGPWDVILGRDLCCGGWRIRARNICTNRRAGTALFRPSKPMESYLSDFLGYEVPSY